MSAVDFFLLASMIFVAPHIPREWGVVFQYVFIALAFVALAFKWALVFLK